MNEIIEKDNIKKLQAAYALNLCTVSVSQIIDYDDVNILEQEYENILNNLNLQNMPDDESLLNILKQLMDTITFFRIQEHDKVMQDKEYQHKMKNAIWNAIPSMNIAVSGSSVVSTVVSAAISLVTSVGTGYMNYRRAKAELQIEKEKNAWALQKAAIEQFNGLRRELFDTAWRLAKKYDFDDRFRLTERQITQYNAILMDTDEVRKYERLTTIKDNFDAYPPFWYYYGNCANYIAHDNSLNLSVESREYYLEEARKNFNQYWKMNQYTLLREDQIAATCALEYADLLDPVNEHDLVCEYLEKALTFSNKANDVVELCIIAYLKLGETDAAVDLLRILVNEGYNSIVNAQILSSIYVNKVLLNNIYVNESLAKEAQKARAGYELLASRINPSFLYRLPKKGENIDATTLQDEFSGVQKQLLTKKFNAVIDAYVDNYSIRFAKLLPDPEDKHYGMDFYFSKEGIDQRIKDMQNQFHSTRKKQRYLSMLEQSNFISEYMSELNRFFYGFSELNGLRDRRALQDVISENIRERSGEINRIQDLINSESDQFNLNDFATLQKLTSPAFFTDFVDEAEAQIEVSVLGMNGMGQYAAAESTLQSFCMKHGIEEPEILIEEGNAAIPDSADEVIFFGTDLLGAVGLEMEKERARLAIIKGIVKNQEEDITAEVGKNGFYLYDSEQFDTFFRESKLSSHKEILQKTIAVYDDRTIHNKDILITTEGIVPIIKGRLKETLTYEEMFSLSKKEVNSGDVLQVGLEGFLKQIPKGIKYVYSPTAIIEVGMKVISDEYSISEKDYQILQPVLTTIVTTLLQKEEWSLDNKKTPRKRNA